MKVIYKMHIDCGRSGDLFGVFVESTERVDCLVKNEIPVYFGEVLGKHSEIYGAIRADHLVKVTEDQAFVKLFEAHGLSSGFNPFNYGTIASYEIDDGECDELTISEIVDILLRK